MGLPRTITTLLGQVKANVSALSRSGLWRDQWRIRCGYRLMPSLDATVEIEIDDGQTNYYDRDQNGIDDAAHRVRELDRSSTEDEEEHANDWTWQTSDKV